MTDKLAAGGQVEVEGLQALIANWRKWADKVVSSAPSFTLQAAAWKQCAYELEKFIEWKRAGEGSQAALPDAMPKFQLGQVIAECFDFGDGKGEFVKSYFSLDDKVLLDMFNANPVQENRPGRKRYYRALNEVESPLCAAAAGSGTFAEGIEAAARKVEQVVGGNWTAKFTKTVCAEIRKLAQGKREPAPAQETK